MRSHSAAAWSVRLVSIAVVFLAWEIYGREHEVFTSYPSAIMAAFIRIFASEILPATLTTMYGFAVGFGIAAPLGIAIGFTMGRSDTAEAILAPYVNAFYVTPRVTLIPLLVLWLGLDFELRVAIVVLSAIFPMIVTVQAGAREVDPDLLDVGRAFVASAAQRLRTIVIPASLPYVFTALRIGLARALTGIVVAEMSAALTGLGRELVTKAKFLRTDELFVPIILIGVIAILLTSSLLKLQRRVTPWHPAGDV